MGKYRVVGPHVVDGRNPGDSYEAQYTEEQERMLTAAGHISVLKPSDRIDPPVKQTVPPPQPEPPPPPRGEPRSTQQKAARKGVKTDG